jgi:hypothetical protein
MSQRRRNQKAAKTDAAKPMTKQQKDSGKAATAVPVLRAPTAVEQQDIAAAQLAQ